jgi:hypothetical protein
MRTPEPDPADVQNAINAYVRLAHPQGPPMVVQSMLSTLKAWGGPFFRCPIFVKDINNPPRRYSVRLGNSFYPHMKLVIEASPDDEKWLYKADSHDRHCCPPASSPEFPAFNELMVKNQRLSEEIENAWAQQGLPTFKTYLQADLARRREEATK